MEHSEIDKIDAAFAAGKVVIAQAAPAVRAALGEEFGYKIGTPVTGKDGCCNEKTWIYKSIRCKLWC
jgi:iron only hydrogenase large subunit-like protein